MAKRVNISCNDCFFKQSGLCSLRLEEPCPTFRPHHADGLKPPRQLAFTFKQERRSEVAWAFPTAQERVAMY